MQQRNPQELAKVLEKKIEARQTRFTKTEAAALTGLEVEAAEVGLRELINRYDCRLQVTENGDLIYDFGGLHRRGEKTWREYWSELGEWLWKVFTYAFKACIAVTMVVYCIIFTLILLVWAFKSESDDIGEGGFSLIGHMFLAIFDWHTATNTVIYRQDQYGYQYAQYQPKSVKKQKDNEKGFIAAVYDFVFGPPRVVADTLENLREAAAFIRTQNGILLPSDIKALSGMNSTEAAAFFAECIARFQGDIKVSENGVMYGEFPQMLRTVQEGDHSTIVYYWDEYEPPHQVTGNSTGQNLGIAALNSFNLIASLVFMFLGARFFPLLLGVFPFLFSLLFFLIPALRSIAVANREEQRHRNNIRKRLVRVIFERRGEPISVAAMTNIVNNLARTVEPLSPEVVESVLEDLRREMPGDLLFPETGPPQYAFPVIGMELEEGIRLRRRQQDRVLGKVVFDTSS
ncbi:MAG: hypothetical protein K1Y36_15330 [Blastocatellia bacterium]|nr:hypothetical protein [Blastocatellia bacterium]